MTTAQIIQVLIPTITALVVYIYHLIFVHLPAKQQKALESFAPRAVGMVEQVSASASNPEKKATAISVVKVLLKTAKLPVPDDAVISTFIESAVYAMKTAPLTVRSGDIVKGTPGLAPMPTPDYLGQPPT